MLPVLFYPQAGHHNVHSVRIAKQNCKIHESDFDNLSFFDLPTDTNRQKQELQKEQTTYRPICLIS